MQAHMIYLEDYLGLLPGRQLEHVPLRLCVLPVEDVHEADEVLLLQPVLLGGKVTRNVQRNGSQPLMVLLQDS